jgi:hypothetical protein
MWILPLRGRNRNQIAKPRGLKRPRKRGVLWFLEGLLSGLLKAALLRGPPFVTVIDGSPQEFQEALTVPRLLVKDLEASGPMGWPGTQTEPFSTGHYPCVFCPVRDGRRDRS